jgi:adenylate kinase family enzyme
VVLAFTGPPCSGKSTLAAEVARRLDVPHLSMDATRQRLLPDAAHTRVDREVAYRAMEWAAEMLPAVVLDAPYGHDEDWVGLVRLGAVVIECHVSPETAVQRFRKRGPDMVRKDLTEEVVWRQVEEYRYRGGAAVIDTEKVSVEDAVSMVLPYWYR